MSLRFAGRVKVRRQRSPLALGLWLVEDWGRCSEVEREPLSEQVSAPGQAWQPMPPRKANKFALVPKASFGFVWRLRYESDDNEKESNGCNSMNLAGRKELFENAKYNKRSCSRRGLARDYMTSLTSCLWDWY